MSDRGTSAEVNTYHCICTTLILATSLDLSLLAKRKENADGALILPLSTTDSDSNVSPTSILQNLVAERKPVVIKRDDGFEKRTLRRCKRCDLVIGYELDETHFDGSEVRADDVVYILPGSLQSTQNMKTEKPLETPSWAQHI